MKVAPSEPEPEPKPREERSFSLTQPPDMPEAHEELHSWAEDYATRPSWCDARVALRQVKNGEADGSKPALAMRGYLQSFLYAVGCFIQRFYFVVLLVCLGIFCAFLAALPSIVIQTDLEKLWVEKGGRLERELNTLANIKKLSDEPVKNESGFEVPSAANFSSSSQQFQVVIQTALTGRSDNVLTVEDFLLHAYMMRNISRMVINLYGFNWTLHDVCLKPEAPKIEGELGDMANSIIQQLMPCVIISPLDCFWEGSWALGPVDKVEEVGFFHPDGDAVDWTNFDPNEVLNGVADMISLAFPEKAGETEDFQKLFQRVGLSKGYLNRPCLDPHNPSCPETAPNYRNANKSRSINKMVTGGCKGVAANLMVWPEELIVGGIKRDHPDSYIRSAQAIESIILVTSAKAMLERVKEFGPTSKQNASELIYDYKKLEKAHMQKIIDAWQRNFSNMVYNSEYNKNVLSRSLFSSQYDSSKEFEAPFSLTRFVKPPPASDSFSFLKREKASVRPMFSPLAGTSLTDMLKEFSKFNYFVILIGYVLMLLYAMATLASCRNGGVHSCAGLGFAGCMLVTLATVAGLGCSTWGGIDFNAATTNIVPFLTLGLGVDDMFLLVHNYIEITKIMRVNELGFLLKETGLSVMLTSINNILAFLCGGLLPVPALRSFCWQVAITLLFNMIAILTMFPAVMAIDLKRRKARRSDLLCCLVHKDKVQPTSGQKRVHSGADHLDSTNGTVNAGYYGGGSSPPFASTPVPANERRAAGDERCNFFWN